MTSQTNHTTPARNVPQPVDLNDPMYAAMNPAPRETRAKMTFGQVTLLDLWFCYLQKGVGKVPFDPAVHPAYKRSTAIKIAVDATKRDGGIYSIERDYLDWTEEWKSVTLPSLTTAGLHLSTLKGAYVQVELVPTGKTYTNKQNAQKEKTAFVFHRTFASADEMHAAEEAYYRHESDEAVGMIPVADLPDDLAPRPAAPRVAAPTTTAAPVAQQTHALRGLAEQAAPAIWQAAQQNDTRFRALWLSNPMFAEALSVEDALELVLPF